jgi:hypothetical protein
LKKSDPVSGKHFMLLCFPSVEPMQFGKFQRSRYLSAMNFRFYSFGVGMNRGCNVVHIADCSLSPLKLETQCREATARSRTPEYRNNLTEPQFHLPTRIDCAFLYCKCVRKERQNTKVF